MNYREQYTAGPAGAVQLSRFWSAHVDSLERYLSAKTWALAAVTAVFISYPVAHILLPVILHRMLPDVVRAVLNLI